MHTFQIYFILLKLSHVYSFQSRQSLADIIRATKIQKNIRFAQAWTKNMSFLLVFIIKNPIRQRFIPQIVQSSQGDTFRRCNAALHEGVTQHFLEVSVRTCWGHNEALHEEARKHCMEEIGILPAGTKNKVPRNRIVTEDFSRKTAATYSPTVTQYHRRDRA